MNVIELEQFIELGYYEQLNTLMKHVTELKGLIREDLEVQDIQRYVWEEHKIVGKFRNVKRYKYDHVSLKEHLLNLGILPVTSTIKTELLLEEERLVLRTIEGEMDYVLNKVRFYPNSKSRVVAPNLFIGQSLKRICISDCVYLWKEYRRLIDKLTIQWNRILEAIGSCFNGDSTEIETIYGKVVVQKKPIYSSINVLKLLGQEALIRCSRIDLEKLEEFTVRGFISKIEINNFRHITDINRQFLLMELSKEERVDAWLFNRREKLMKISMNCTRDYFD